jgi:MFS family permease
MGTLFGTATLLSALIGIALAALSDRFGRKYLISFYWLVCAAGTSIFTFLISPFALLSGKAISDFSKYNLWNTLLARFSDISKKEHRGAIVGAFTAAFGLSYAISHMLAGAIIDNFGFIALFLSAVAISLLMAALSLMLKEVGKRKHRMHLSLNILKTRNGILNAIVSVFTGFASTMVYSYIIYLFFKYQFGFDAAQIGFFISALFIIWSASSYLIGPRIDKIGIRKSIFLGGILNAAVWIAAIFFNDLVPFLILMALDNLTWPLYGVGTMKLSTVLPEEENVGRDVSIFGFAHTIGVVLAAFSAGMLAELSFSHVFAARAASVLLGGAIAFFLMKLKH